MASENLGSEPTPHADELAILLNQEQVKAKLDELGDETKALIQGVIDSVERFLTKLG